MAYDITYGFTSQANSDIGWDYNNSVIGAHDVAVENTDQYWCWTDDGSTSSSTGPPSGTACIYTETSSPTSVGEIFTMTLESGSEVDASLYALFVEFDSCVQGNTDGELKLEAWDGSSWNQIDSILGDSVTTFTSQGPYDLSAYNNTDFSIRLTITVGSDSNSYHNDFAVTDVHIYGDDKVTATIPSITDVGGDETINIGQTGVTITGIDFQSEGANSRVRIDSSSTGNGTSQTQVDTSWSDTSVDFTVSQGSLSLGTNYLFIRNQEGEENPVGFTITLESAVPVAPTISDVDGDESITIGQTDVVITGNNFETEGSNSRVRINSSSNGLGTDQIQVDTSWGNTSIQFVVSQGSLSAGTNYLFVRNESLLENAVGFTITLVEPAKSDGLYKSAIISTVIGDEGIEMVILMIGDE